MQGENIYVQHSKPNEQYAGEYNSSKLEKYSDEDTIQIVEVSIFELL